MKYEKGKYFMLAGIIPAVVTPFDTKANSTSGRSQRLWNGYTRPGVHGLYLCGLDRRRMLQTVAQRKQVAEVAMRIRLRTNRSSSTSAPTPRMKRSNWRGTPPASARHAVSSLPPCVGLYSFAEIKSYYERLAEASDIPLLIIYFFPEVAPAIKTAAQVLELAAIENVAGLEVYRGHREGELE